MKTKEEIAEEMARQDEERKKIADEQKAMLEEQRRLAKEANEKNAKAEGMLEAVKTFQAMQASNGGKKEWGKEEWDAFQEKTGISKEGITAIDNALGARLTDVSSKFEERAKAAEDRAKAAEDRFSGLEKTRSLENQKRDYLSKKPQFARYEKDFSDFVNDYPAEMLNDPEKRAKIFERAETFIKGKVGDKGMRNPNGGSTRFNSSDEGEGEEGETEVDLSDLRGHERAMVEKILPSKERNELLKANKHDLKGDSGVMINTRDEFNKYNKK